MQPSLLTNNEQLSPCLELGAYEYLWDKQASSYKQVNDLLIKEGIATAQELVGRHISYDYYQKVTDLVGDNFIKSTLTLPRYCNQFPKRLGDAKHPVALINIKGDASLLYRHGLAIVGSRNPTQEGLRRARKIAYLLASKGYVIISGLASGIDRSAHLAALEAGGRTIGVLGTPLSSYYPKENRDLQDEIATKHLIISSVPYIRHHRTGPKLGRTFFPERNKLMSALSFGTIIVEAGETSGTLIQARAAIEQGRNLFILQSCFENKNISWPHKYEKMGAIRVRSLYDIEQRLQSTPA